MMSENKNSYENPSSKHTERLGYYGGSTSLGMLPRDTNWLKELLHLLHLVKDDRSDAREDAKPAQDH